MPNIEYTQSVEKVLDTTLDENYDIRYTWWRHTGRPF